MDNREAKRILSYVDYELTLTSDNTDWEKLARMVYSVGSYLLDRQVAIRPVTSNPTWEPAATAVGVLFDELNGKVPPIAADLQAHPIPGVKTTGSHSPDNHEVDVPFIDDGGCGCGC